MFSLLWRVVGRTKFELGYGQMGGVVFVVVISGVLWPWHSLSWEGECSAWVYLPWSLTWTTSWTTWRKETTSTYKVCWVFSVLQGLSWACSRPNHWTGHCRFSSIPTTSKPLSGSGKILDDIRLEHYRSCSSGLLPTLHYTTLCHTYTHTNTYTHQRIHLNSNGLVVFQVWREFISNSLEVKGGRKKSCILLTVDF